MMRSLHDACRILIVSLMLTTAPMAAQAATESTPLSMEQPWSINVGGGFTPVVGGYNQTISDGWNFTVGAGYKFTEKLGLNLEYMNNHLGVQDGVLHQFSNKFGGAPIDGSTHVWSVTLNPKWNFELNHVVGGYLIGGGGFYHVNAQLTTPSAAFVPPYCDYYWGCWPGGFTSVDRIVGEHKDDTGGVNVGLGITFNLRYDLQFYVESRYHYIFLHGPDLQLFPVVAGFRFS